MPVACHMLFPEHSPCTNIPASGAIPKTLICSLPLNICSLIFYRYVYPRHANEVPRWVWHKLLERFESALMNPDLAAPFRGSLIDENMFAIDVQEWGLENEIERYRDEHRRQHREHHKSS